MDKFNIKLQAEPHTKDRLNMQLQSGSHLSVQMAQGATPRDYNALKNLPSINGVRLSGDKTPEDLHIVSENTTDGWAQMPLYIPRKGEICLYTDTGVLKIGDGSVPIVDLPMVGGDMESIDEAINRHAQDATIHVTAEERDLWNAKLNCCVVAEELIFNRN